MSSLRVALRLIVSFLLRYPSGRMPSSRTGQRKTEASRRGLRLVQDRLQLPQMRLVGLAKNELRCVMVAAAYNLVRIEKLLLVPEPA